MHQRSQKELDGAKWPLDEINLSCEALSIGSKSRNFVNLKTALAAPLPNNADAIVVNFNILQETSLKEIYRKIGSRVLRSSKFGVVVKQSSQEEASAQHQALELLAKEGFSPPASRLIKQVLNDDTPIKYFLLMDLIPQVCLQDGRRSRFIKGFGIIHREFESSAMVFLSENGFNPDVWHHKEGTTNVGLKQGVIEKWKIEGKVEKSDFIPFDPVIGFN